MGNDPSVEIVARQRSDLTDRIAKEVIRNFGTYNAGPYMRLAGCEDAGLDGYRHLRLGSPQGTMEEVERYGKRRIAQRFLDVDFAKHPRVMGSMRYAAVCVFTDISADEEPSVSAEFPYTAVQFLLDPVVDDTEGIARIACGPPLELIKLDGLGLTSEQEDQFRVVPYWQGCEVPVTFNHFRYGEFKKLGIDGLTRAFLDANTRR